MNAPEAALVLEQYRRVESAYSSFGKSLSDLISRVLASESLGIHSITYRTKDPDHLREKLLRPQKTYSVLTDVTDLLGLRVITYFESDVDRVVAALRREFRVSDVHSVDKRKEQDVTSFGYASVHLVCQLSTERLNLPEYKPFAEMLCEIQVRSILQHAWAEIEHDLGYKASHGVPLPIRRRFSMLSGLFELADQEFIRLRDDLNEYSARVKNEINTASSDLLVDNVSLEAFVQTNPLSTALDQDIMNWVKAVPEPAGVRWIERRVQELQYVGMRTIQELQQSLDTNSAAIGRLASSTFIPEEYEELPTGISIFLLFQVLLGCLPQYEDTLRGVTEFRLGDEFDYEEYAEILRKVAAST